MLADLQSAEILARLLADPKSFTVRDDELIKKLETHTMSIAPTAEQWAGLCDSTRFFLAIARLKMSLAEQRKALGSNWREAHVRSHAPIHLHIRAISGLHEGCLVHFAIDGAAVEPAET